VNHAHHLDLSPQSSVLSPQPSVLSPQPSVLSPQSSDVVTRFAPSPTGLLHLGNVRTALLNWLFARRHGGRFLLRLEDTDAQRSEQHYVNAIMEDLRWLGLDWDGEALFQSQHAAGHQQALHALAEDGLAYRCFCSEHQLALDHKLAASRGQPPRYSGRCRQLPGDESCRRSESEPFVWRLAVHAEDGYVHVRDALRGDIAFARRDLDDPVVLRSDGRFTFLLPNAVDDAAEGVSHVLRGDDHLTNSAYQVWLLERLGRQAPVYLHHGLLLGADGAKLSKRTGSCSVATLREQGLLPEALVQVMARLGHPNVPEDAVSLRALARHFEAEHVSTAAVHWSDEAMWRWHTRLLHALPVEQLAGMIRGHLPQADQAFTDLVRGNLERAEDALHYRRLLDAGAGPDEAAMTAALAAGEAFYRAALTAWKQQDQADWKSWTQAVKVASGCTGKSLFMPLRVALTGAMHGPEMSRVIEFLGVDGVRARLEDMLRRVSAMQAFAG